MAVAVAVVVVVVGSSWGTGLGAGAARAAAAAKARTVMMAFMTPILQFFKLVKTKVVGLTFAFRNDGLFGFATRR